MTKGTRGTNREVTSAAKQHLDRFQTGRTSRTSAGYIKELFGQELTISEDDGARTRNHRIDSPKTERGNAQEHQATHCNQAGAWGQSPPFASDAIRVARAWDTLPEPIRRAILALVDAAGGKPA